MLLQFKKKSSGWVKDSLADSVSLSSKKPLEARIHPRIRQVFSGLLLYIQIAILITSK